MFVDKTWFLRSWNQTDRFLSYSIKSCLSLFSITNEMSVTCLWYKPLSLQIQLNFDTYGIILHWNQLMFHWFKVQITMISAIFLMWSDLRVKYVHTNVEILLFIWYCKSEEQKWELKNNYIQIIYSHILFCGNIWYQENINN